MESIAHLRDFRMAPRKVALVADLVRGKPVGSALNILLYTRKAAAKPMAKLIRSAVANATDLSKGLKTRNNKRTDGMIIKRRGQK